MRAPLLAVLLTLGLVSPALASPADEFVARLSGLCGKAFEGKVVASSTPNDPFTGQRLVMHVRECSADEVRIPFHVGENRSRTWVITRTPTGLRLKHDHRHEDGSEDKVTQYGGDTVAPGSVGRQEFPADAFSKEMFRRENLPPGAQENVWAVEVEPGKAFTYELSRPGRLFRAEFDLTKPVDPPPAPWGAK
ncbi:hypothetical protein HHL28_09710 [Aerophototrophica crusticola]|uniref:Secreted protein n=1 Tax=Aerophototrophica crusticola TaxID=1709002 RepID=A0A858R818_9PROT|nr:hypothetical protein HHL28_09710 [Rhodospirillaceae bacterium B3]